MRNKKTVFVVQAAIIATMYMGLTYTSNMLNLAFGGIQLRFSEALTILTAFSPASIAGLTVGCLLSNISSPLGLLDITFGTVATLLAGILSYKTRNIKFKDLPILSPIFPVLINAVIVGLENTIFMPQGFALEIFLITAGQIAIGQIFMCYGLGLPLYRIIKSSKLNMFFN